jgi:hypothetical protein
LLAINFFHSFEIALNVKLAAIFSSQITYSKTFSKPISLHKKLIIIVFQTKNKNKKIAQRQLRFHNLEFIFFIET